MSFEQLFGYFAEGTRDTVTGGQIGMEIETDFMVADQPSQPIGTEVTRQILATTSGQPSHCITILELGRQKIELAIAPQPNADILLEAALEALDWLYEVAASYGAIPRMHPEVTSDEELLWVQEERDEIWMALDGRPALEELCRCSSVQFTVDIHPGDAMEIVNRLWKLGIHQSGYHLNDTRWRAYIAKSLAGYRTDRYAGPEGFDNLAHYCQELLRHEVVMHQGQPCRRMLRDVPDADLDLFLRSIWWHYRLRRYKDNLTVEIRPFGRYDDEHDLTRQLATVRRVFNL